jgi:tRNA(fMet)-specific endonuclease VapC
MKYLLDTNCVIRFLDRPGSPVARRITAVLAEDVVLCSIVKAELYYGVYRSRRPEQKQVALTEFFQHFLSLPFDDRSAEEYGRVRAHLALRGEIIGPNDLLVAAIALANDLTLVTHNTREFGRVPGLRIED